MGAISRREVTRQLLALDVRPGGVLVVHTAFSRVRPLEGGPEGLIAALREALGPEGTLVMPSMSDEDDAPFDVAATPCRGLGVVADTFRNLPGVLRSDNPHAFAAIGPRAAEITKAHPIDVPHGLDSPIGRVLALDGQVLLLGAGHDANTTVHLAENMAGVRYGIEHHVTVIDGGKPVRVDYREIDHCCEGFAQLDEWLGEKQRRGVVGHATARLADSRDVVDAALRHLRENELVFLCIPPGRVKNVTKPAREGCGFCIGSRRTITAKTRNGATETFEGTYTLRRSVVEGASAADRRWHLYRATIRRISRAIA